MFNRVRLCFLQSYSEENCNFTNPEWATNSSDFLIVWLGSAWPLHPRAGRSQSAWLTLTLHMCSWTERKPSIRTESNYPCNSSYLLHPTDNKMIAILTFDTHRIINNLNCSTTSRIVSNAKAMQANI